MSATSQRRDGYLQSRGGSRPGRRATSLLGLLAVLVAALAFPLAAFASDGADAFDPIGGSGPLSAGPSISSHKDDYAPGELVILTGAGWQPGESVRVVVDDDGVAEQRWQRDVTVTADEAGAIADQFNLPAWFVADYSVTATGGQSGAATTSFTDAVKTVTSLTSSVSRSDIGQPVTFTATVSCFTAGTCSTLQANPVEFVENGGGQDNCNNGTVLGSVVPNGSDPKNLVTAALTHSFASSGSRIIAACYRGGGSGSSPGASGAPVNHDVNPGAPAKLAFTAAPSATLVDNEINGGTGVNVTVQDEFGTTTPDAAVSVTLALGSNPGSGALSGTKTVAAQNGVATFTGLSIDKAANGYTLTASSSGLAGATSASFNITKRASATAVVCFPNPTGLNQPTTCTATVSDTSAGNASAPTGNVTWTRSGSGTGTFSNSSCTLNGSGSSASCSVTYTPTSGTSHTVAAAYAGDAKHNAASNANRSVTINSLSASTLSVDAASGTFGGTTTLSATLKKSDGTALSGKTVSFQLNGVSAGTATTSSSGVATKSGASLAGIAVGTYDGAVVATFNGDSSANGSTGSNKLTVNPNCTAASVTAHPQAASIAYGADATFTAAGTGNPAPSVQWQVKSEGAEWADLSGQTGSTLTLTKPAVSLNGNQYRAVYSNSCGGTQTAESTPATLTVAAKALTGSFNSADKVYNGDVDAAATDRALVGAVEGDEVSLTGGTAEFDDKNVGDRTATLTGAELAGKDKDNYTLESVATAAARVTPLGITGTFSSEDKVYDGTMAAAANDRALVGAVEGDEVSLTGGTAEFDDKNVGDRTATLTGAELAGEDADNYTLESVATAAAKITPLALTGSFTANNKQYDGNRDATVDGKSLPGVIGDDVVQLEVDNALFEDKHVGTGKDVEAALSLSGADAGNYTVNASHTATANITAMALTGSFTAESKQYDGTRGATVASKSLPGVIGDDEVMLVVGEALFDTKAVGTAKDVEAALSLSGADAGNYTVNASHTANADITPLALTGSFTANNKQYDGNRNATVDGKSLPGVIGDDVVQLEVDNALFEDKHVGTGKDVEAALSLSGADAGNYTVNASHTTNADITPLALTGSFTANNKQYDGNRDATVDGKSLPGVIGDDVVQLEVDNALFEDKHVGTGKDVEAALSLSGADAGNYTVNAAHTANADITARPITVAADAKTKLEGEADPALTYKVTEGSLLDGDVLAGGLTRDAGETPGSYAIKQGTLDNSDYKVTYVGANLTIVPVCSKTAAFQAPIKDGTRNIVKAGNVIPVKLSFRDCNGNVVTGRKLEIRVLQGVVNPADTSDGSAVIVESVSSADTSGVMRLADGQYMYNLSTKGLNSGQDFTIVVRDTTGSEWTAVPRLATAVIQPKK